MSSTGRFVIETQGLKEDLKTLSSLDRKLRLEFGKKFRAVAKPTVDAINQDKKPIKEIRGFDHNGRTGARNLKAVKVDINTRKARKRNISESRQYETLSTIRIRTYDAPTAIADMAGKVGNYQTSGRSRPYANRPEGHELVGQGEYLAQKLNAEFGNTASRFMWPTAERMLPETTAEIQAIVRQVEIEANKLLMKVRR
jgi:hypothetical protein